MRRMFSKNQLLELIGGVVESAIEELSFMENPMTTAGDIIVGGSSGTPSRLGIGTTGQVLKVGSSGLEWANESGGGMTNPMTTAGDIIVGGSSGTPSRLGIGTDGQVLKLVSGAPAWANESGGGGGTQLYLHTLFIKQSEYTDAGFNIILISSKSDAYTMTTLKNEISTNGSLYTIINVGTKQGTQTTTKSINSDYFNACLYISDSNLTILYYYTTLTLQLDANNMPEFKKGSGSYQMNISNYYLTDHVRIIS